MENLCYFVCSRGLLKSCTFHSLNPISSCATDYKYLNHMITSNALHDGNSIYVCSELLPYFVNIILPKINKHFVLVTGDSDITVPIEAITPKQTNILINNPFLCKWFAQNTQMYMCDKIIQLPIGLDYHTISTNPSHNWRTNGEGYLPRYQEHILLHIRQNMSPFQDRINKIYINFSLENDRFKQREIALKQIPEELMVKNLNFTKRTQNWKNMTDYAFVLSPFGNGMDCHRTWEALCLGCIPILKAPNFKKMFENLPVLIVNEWTDITQELLNNTIQEFQSQQFNYEKLTIQYWTSQINH